MSSVARLFVGVDLHLSVCEKMVLMQEDLQPILKQRSARVRWTAPENLHLTLKYIGDVDRSLIRHVQDALKEAVREQEPFLFLSAGLGAFPSGACPRLLYIPTTEYAEKVCALAGRVDEVLAEIGIEKSAQPFQPWALLGRVKTLKERVDLTDVMGALSDLELGGSEVRDLVIFESLLTPKGARYRVLSRVHLPGVIEAAKNSSRRRSKV